MMFRERLSQLQRRALETLPSYASGADSWLNQVLLVSPAVDIDRDRDR